jgi:hypothetical protein
MVCVVFAPTDDLAPLPPRVDLVGVAIIVCSAMLPCFACMAVEQGDDGVILIVLLTVWVGEETLPAL